MQDLDLQAVSQRMNLIATELQEEVTKTRQPPIGNIWNRFPHTVRDLAHNCGEEARLEMEGKTPNSTAHMRIAAQSSRGFGSPKFCPPQRNQLFVRLLR
jgi:hypothetical protein